MKKYILLPLIFMMLAKYGAAQMGAIKGSGKIVSKTFNYKNFDKIFIKDFDGNVEIENGEAYAISISIDDNLEKLLAISEEGGELKITLNNNLNNKLYLENTNIKVKISLPNLSQIKQEGNNKTIVNNITANKFVVKCSGNGDLICSGITNNVKIVSNGNGNVNTKKLISKNASVTKTGNGNIYINTKNKFMVKSTGNGDVVNVGEGKASEESVVEGNGEIIIEN